MNKNLGKAGGLLLAVFVLFTGCTWDGSSASKEQEKISSVSVANKAEHDTEKQFRLIIENRKKWCFDSKEAKKTGDGLTESDYRYYVTDMDRNGRLELISTETIGNGSVFYNRYFEVNASCDKLTEITPLSLQKKKKGKDKEKLRALTEVDWWDLTGGYGTGYYDSGEESYHYNFTDHTHESGAVTQTAEKDFILKEAKISVDTVSKETTDLEKIHADYYDGMEEFMWSFKGFRAIDEEAYENDGNVVLLNDAVLYEKLRNSYEAFSVVMLKERNVTENPYFPEKNLSNIKVKVLKDVLFSADAAMTLTEEYAGKDGRLYAFSFDGIENVQNSEITEQKGKQAKKLLKQTKKDITEELDWDGCHLWVTKDQIYYIPYNFFDEDDLGTLLCQSKLPSDARLICQENEKKDLLSEGEIGEHEWMEKHDGDINCYRSYYSKGKDYEGVDIVQFVFKKEIGLIGVRFMNHAAGGGSIIVWQDGYLKQEDNGFTIDQ